MEEKEEIKVKSEEREAVNMHSCHDFITVPSFPLKAYEIVSDPENSKVVRWTEEGDAFIITNKNAFSDQVLPKYFKHKNLSTFIRQLNIYGFKKTKYKNEEHCFAHKDFRRDDKLLLKRMKRKTNKKQNDVKSQSSVESTTISRNEVNQMFEKLSSRIDEQDSKISQLVQANKEFKNSVLALYSQLEKSKEREKKMEKLLSDRQMNVLLDSKMNEQLENLNIPGLDGSFGGPSKQEMFQLFASFIKNFIQQFNRNDMSTF